MRPARRWAASSPARSTTAASSPSWRSEVDVDHVRRRERAGRGGRGRSLRRSRFCRRSTALGASQDRLHEKTLFRQLKIPTPAFAAVDSLEDLRGGGREDRHCRACSRRADSATTVAASSICASPQDVETAWQTLGSRAADLRRLRATSAARSRSSACAARAARRGSIRSRRTRISAGILRYSIAPYRHASLQKQAETYLKRLLRHFDYAGVLTIEFFVARRPADRQRDGAARSQFRPLDHRGRADQPVRESRARDPRPAARQHPAAWATRAMMNFIGTHPALGNILRVSGVHFHSYGKEPRPNRKLGHCTINAPSPAARDRALQQLLRLKVD